MKTALLLIIILIGSQTLFGQFGEINYLEANARLPRNIQIGDMDGDGDNDIISAQWFHGRIGFHENLGGGEFHASRLIDDLSSVVSYVQIVDVDGDGFLDVVCAHYGAYRVIWYKNNGDGTFMESELLVHSISNIEEVRVLDIDVDGDMDVVIGRSGGGAAITWHENIGGFYYAHTVASNYWHIEVADLNGDGLPDIIGGAEGLDKVAWFENIGGDFSGENVISLSLDGPTSVHDADINGDGLPDVVVTSKDDDKVTWFENMGDETFGSENTVTSAADGAEHACSADIDNDGDLDIVVAAKVGDEYLWYENLADGALFTEHLIGVEDDAYYVTAGDLNGDGNVDIAMNSNNGAKLISWSENLGSELDTPKRITSRMDVVTSLNANDLDGDGDLDIIASAENYYKVAWFENLGDNNFNVADTIPANQFEAFSVISGDTDGDGDIDIVSVGDDGAYSSHITWNENLGGGTFAPAITLAEDLESPEFVELIDMDGDGDLDLVGASSLYPLYEFVWYENIGGVFSTEHIISTTYFVQYAEFNDFDLDGDMDVIIFQYTNASLLENLGDGTFSDEIIIESDYSLPRGMCILDVDIDGDMDLVLAATPGPILAWYENDAGTFSSATPIGDTDVKFSVRAADVNLDGKEDLVVSAIEEPGDHDYRQVQWFENIGDGTFGSEASLFLHEDGTNNAITADIDGDGDQEVVFGTTGTTGGTIGWLESYHFSSLQIKGNLFTDMNLNGVKDEDESPVDFIGILSSPEADIAFTYENGEYNLIYDATGTYIVQPEEVEHWSIVTDSTSYTVEVDGGIEELDSLDFGFYPDSIFTDLHVDLTGGFPRCNESINYWGGISNSGTTILSECIVELILDDDLTFVEAEVTPDSIVGQHIYWTIDELDYFEDVLFNSTILTPGIEVEDSSLTSVLNVYTIDEDMEEVVFSDTLLQILVCAYDPNDKQSTPMGIDSMGYISTETETIEYFIRFQNTGTDTAFNITIVDQLDENLDWSTFTPINSSHDVSILLSLEGEITFQFDDIMLPDSNVNQLGSQGFIKYEIDLIDGLEAGTSIYNYADIYFDENPAIVTNTKILTLYDCSSAFADLTLPEEICQNETVIGHLDPEIGSSVIEWDVDGETFEGPSFDWTASSDGLISINLTVSTDLCERDTTLEILVHPSPEFTFDPIYICENDSTLIFEEHQFEPGIYYDTLSTIHGCDSILNQELIVYDLPEVNFTSLEDEMVCLGSDLITLVGTPSGGEFSGPGISGTTFDPDMASEGEHILVYSFEDDNGCSATDSVNISVVDCLGINEQNGNQILIYPNPFDDFTVLNFGKDLIENHTVIIHNALGQEVYRNENVTGNSLEIKKSELGVGIYVLSVLNYDAEVLFNTKLIVE